MIKCFETLKSALPYLHDKEVKALHDKLLRQIDRDADEVGFTSSSSTDRVIKELEEKLNEMDEAKQEIRQLQKQVEADMEDEDRE